MGVPIKITTNYPVWSRENHRIVKRVQGEIREANVVTMFDMLATMHRHTSGRPGPMVRSGRLQDSLWVAMDIDKFGFEAGARTEYATRLEYGFVGVDSRGRHYFQPPYPFLRPSAEEVWPRYVERIAKALHSAYS